MEANDIEATDIASNLITDADGFKIKGAASSARHHAERKDAFAGEACTICLEPITERAVAVPCNHLAFDFLCLASWLQEKSTCPLCNAAISEIQYDFRDPEDFKTYHVPTIEAKVQIEGTFEPSRRRRGQDFIRRRLERAQLRPAAPGDPALERRRRVYRDKLYSLHVGANRLSGHRDFTPQDFTASENLQRRARMFLRRELQVFSFLDTAAAPRGGNREFLLEYIVAILKTNELKGASGHAEDLLADYLGRDNALLLLHELEAWLRSPHAQLKDWDTHVQYSGDRTGPTSKAETV